MAAASLMISFSDALRDEESDDKVNEVASLLNPAHLFIKKERKKNRMTTEVKHEMKRLE